MPCCGVLSCVLCCVYVGLRSVVMYAAVCCVVIVVSVVLYGELSWRVLCVVMCVVQSCVLCCVVDRVELCVMMWSLELCCSVLC